MALITFVRAWRQFEPDRTQEIGDGVADVLVQRGIAVPVTLDSDVEESMREEPSPLPEIVTKDVKRSDPPHLPQREESRADGDASEPLVPGESAISVTTRDVPGPKDSRRLKK